MTKDENAVGFRTVKKHYNDQFSTKIDAFVYLLADKFVTHLKGIKKKKYTGQSIF